MRKQIGLCFQIMASCESCRTLFKYLLGLPKLGMLDFSTFIVGFDSTMVILKFELLFLVLGLNPIFILFCMDRCVIKHTLV